MKSEKTTRHECPYYYRATIRGADGRMHRCKRCRLTRGACLPWKCERMKPDKESGK